MTTLRPRVEVGPCREKSVNPAWYTGLRLCHVFRVLFAAFILTLAVTSTAPAAVKTGVTVLVHGFVSRDGTNVPPYEYWGGGTGPNLGRNLTELLERFGSGKVWEYDRGSGEYVDITDRVPDGDWVESDLGQHILLFDWTDGSDEPESGQAEAAADVLFASLLNFRYTGSQRIISISPYAAVRPLHFIGHSRGTVVVSETVQRLGRFNIRVNYVTYLDIHDFGQPGPILRDHLFHDPAVQVWENIDHVDAVYQQNPAAMCGVNPAGRPLGLPEELERDVTTLTALPFAENCLLHQRPHAWVKEYYWATVNPSGPNMDRPQRWFEEDNGVGSVRGFGFDRWFARGGFDQEPNPTLPRVRCVVAGDAVPYVWDPPDENHASDRNDAPPVFFNGDFDLPNLDGGIGNTEGNSLAGWYYFGGGGSAFMGSDAGDYHLKLGFEGLGVSALVARHNRFFLPLEARDLLFAMNVPFTPLTVFEEYLRVRVGSEVLGEFSANTRTDGFQPRRVNLRNFPGLLGRVNTLTFEVVTAPLDEVTVLLDNINIVTEPTTWIASFFRSSASNWRLLWRSWPSATIQLQSSSDLLNWATIQTSSGAGNSGSFNIPHTAGPQVFFRLGAVPER